MASGGDKLRDQAKELVKDMLARLLLGRLQELVTFTDASKPVVLSAGRPAPENDPADVTAVRKYFASETGFFPGDLHEQFGMGVAHFGQATGLIRLYRPSAGGGSGEWVWSERRPEQVGAGPSVGNDAEVDDYVRFSDLPVIFGEDAEWFMDTSGKVQKEITYRRGGKTFRRKQWVRVDQDQPAGSARPAPTGSDPSASSGTTPSSAGPAAPTTPAAATPQAPTTPQTPTQPAAVTPQTPTIPQAPTTPAAAAPQAPTNEPSPSTPTTPAAAGGKPSIWSRGIQSVQEKYESIKSKAQKALEATRGRLSKTRGGRTILQVGGGLVKVARWLEHVGLYAMNKSIEAAVEAARERGQPEDKLKRLKRTLYAFDFAGGYVTGGAAAAMGLPLVAVKAAMFLPSASVAYLAYSAVKNPAATWRAARKVMKGMSKKDETHHSETFAEGFDMTRLAELLSDRLDRHAANSDWYLALCLAAFAETKDPLKAIEAADRMIVEHPSGPTSDDTEEDLDELRQIEVPDLPDPLEVEGEKESDPSGPDATQAEDAPAPSQEEKTRS